MNENNKRLLQLVCLKCYPLFLAMCENFRNNRLKNYGSCSSHYMGTLALIWYAMLNMTKVELEFIPDPHMYLFFEKKYGRWSFLGF